MAETRYTGRLDGAAVVKAMSRVTAMASVDCLVAVNSDDGLLRVPEEANQDC